MKLTVRGNKLEVTDSIRNYVEEKLGKLDKYFEEADEINANVLFRIQGKNQIVEVTVPIKKYILRGHKWGHILSVIGMTLGKDVSPKEEGSNLLWEK